MEIFLLLFVVFHPIFSSLHLNCLRVDVHLPSLLVITNRNNIIHFNYLFFIFIYFLIFNMYIHSSSFASIWAVVYSTSHFTSALIACSCSCWSHLFTVIEHFCRHSHPLFPTDIWLKAKRKMDSRRIFILQKDRISIFVQIGIKPAVYQKSQNSWHQYVNNLKLFKKN